MPTHGPIPEAFVLEYNTNMQAALQQRESVFANAVMTGPCSGERMSQVDYIAPRTMIARTTRNADTPNVASDYARRWVKPFAFHDGEIVDSIDKVRMRIAPDSAIYQSMAMAALRTRDDLIFDAFFGVAQCGKEGTDTIAYNVNMFTGAALNMTVARNYKGLDIAPADTGLTRAKLRRAKKNLQENKVMLDYEEIFVAITSNDQERLKQELEQSNDGGNNQVIYDAKTGKITALEGFQFKIYEEIPATTGVRELPYWAKSGMFLGNWLPLTGQIFRRPDKSNEIQLYYSMMEGATRTDEKRVGKILVNE